MFAWHFHGTNKSRKGLTHSSYGVSSQSVVLPCYLKAKKIVAHPFYFLNLPMQMCTSPSMFTTNHSRLRLIIRASKPCSSTSPASFFINQFSLGIHAPAWNNWPGRVQYTAVRSQGSSSAGGVEFLWLGMEKDGCSWLHREDNARKKSMTWADLWVKRFWLNRGNQPTLTLSRLTLLWFYFWTVNFCKVAWMVFVISLSKNLNIYFKCW